MHELFRLCVIWLSVLLELTVELSWRHNACLPYTLHTRLRDCGNKVNGLFGLVEGIGSTWKLWV